MIHRWSHVQEFEGHQDLDYETIILSIKLSIMRLSCLSFSDPVVSLEKLINGLPFLKY